MVRYVGGLKITVLAPSVRLRTAYDTYGVGGNDASIVLKVEFPAVRISTAEVDGHQKRRDLRLGSPWSIILGADAQTRSWSHVTADFAPLHRGHDTDLPRGPQGLRPRRPVRADPQGVAPRLQARHQRRADRADAPPVSLISSVGGGGRRHFRTLATQAIAEALYPSTQIGTAQPADADLGIHYTGGRTDDGRRSARSR